MYHKKETVIIDEQSIETMKTGFEKLKSLQAFWNMDNNIQHFRNSERNAILDASKMLGVIGNWSLDALKDIKKHEAKPNPKSIKKMLELQERLEFLQNLAVRTAMIINNAIIAKNYPDGNEIVDTTHHLAQFSVTAETKIAKRQDVLNSFKNIISSYDRSQEEIFGFDSNAHQAAEILDKSRNLTLSDKAVVFLGIAGATITFVALAGAAGLAFAAITLILIISSGNRESYSLLKNMKNLENNISEGELNNPQAKYKHNRKEKMEKYMIKDDAQDPSQTADVGVGLTAGIASLMTL